MTSINDAILLHSLIFELLYKKVADRERCNAVVITLQKIMFATEIGQMLDLHTIHPTTNCLIYEYCFPFALRLSIETLQNPTTTKSSPTRQLIIQSACQSTWDWFLPVVRRHAFIRLSFKRSVCSLDASFRFETIISTYLQIPLCWGR